MLSFAQVKCTKMDGTSVVGSKRLCHRFWGYACKIQPDSKFADGRRGDVYFTMKTRHPQGYAIGPVVIMDTHQERAGLNGEAFADDVPQQGSIIFGVDQRNTRAKATPFQMKWWNGNGAIVFNFVQAITGAARAGLNKWRRELRQRHGMRDGLFALFLLIVVGDVETFVKQHKGEVQGDPLQLTAEDDVKETSPLTFAVHAARSFGDEKLEAAIVEAASRANITDWVCPPRRTPTHDELAEHADWEEPNDMALNPSRRASGTLATILHEYGEVVVNAEPATVFHGGFAQFMCQQLEEEGEGMDNGNMQTSSFEEKYNDSYYEAASVGYSGDYTGPAPQDTYQHPRQYTEDSSYHDKGEYNPARSTPRDNIQDTLKAVHNALGLPTPTTAADESGRPMLSSIFEAEKAFQAEPSNNKAPHVFKTPKKEAKAEATAYCPSTPLEEGEVPMSPPNVEESTAASKAVYCPSSPVQEGDAPTSPGYVPHSPPDASESSFQAHTPSP